MTGKKMVNTYLYTRYERFWHWLQTALISILLVTGFEVDGLYTQQYQRMQCQRHQQTDGNWVVSDLDGRHATSAWPRHRQKVDRRY